MPKIYFQIQNLTCEAKEGETILSAARKAGVLIEAPCNGGGTCGKCKVRIGDIEHAMLETVSLRHTLSEQDRAAGYVLACATKVMGDITVYTQSTAEQNKTLKIVSDGKAFQYEIHRKFDKRFDGQNTQVFSDGIFVGSEAGNTEKELYGLSVDIGTTTVVVALVNLITGKEIAAVSSLNPQSLHAQDVLTRIHYASSEEGLSVMYQGITDALNSMIANLAQETGIDAAHIYEVVYSGNTTMIHLACNVNPKPLGRYPYTPILMGGESIPAGALTISPFGKIYLPPVISAYVGPDITSGVLVCQLEKLSGTTLFIDIGTNGEMVIAKDGVLHATSTAAGPAFEGMNIAFGMRAGNGALERFEITPENEVNIKVIGDETAIGICGSGLLDLAGELVRVGIIGANGRFQSVEKGGYAAVLKSHITEYEGKTAFEAVEGIYLTTKDIRQIQLAKGAVRAGIEALLLSLDVTADEVDRVIIAGSFGYHLKTESLINIGLLPAAFAGKVEFAGNTSKTGGSAFLLNTDLRAEMEETVKRISVAELSNREDFDKLFVKALNF